MAKRHIPESHSAHPNVTPLIDIIMCLIIFFMLVAKIGVTTGAVEIDKLPTTILGTRIDDMSNTLTLNIPDKLNDEFPLVSALIKPPGGGDAALHSLQMDNNGNDELLKTLTYYKNQNPEFKVIIRAKSDLDWRFVEKVLLDCTAAGVRSINFSTLKSKE